LTVSTHTDVRPTAPLATTLERFFATKTSCDIDGTMAFFSPDLVTYTDATLGWDLDSFDALRGVFAQYMPGWAPPARSYTTGVLSNGVSALVHMVDTPELFGGELRILAAVDFRDGKIVRWVDYWDAAAYPEDLYVKFRTPGAQFLRDLKDSEVPTQAAPELVDAAAALQHAFAAGDASAVARLLHTDATFGDLSLRTQLIGRIETARYLDRALNEAPYGQSSTLRHMVGGPAGGGFEWTAGPHHDHLVGVTAIELGPDGLITKVASVYDSRQVPPTRRAALAGSAIAP
jgi:ketosteroid isomerase-like protein